MKKSLTPYQQDIVNTYDVYGNNRINNLIQICSLIDSINVEKLIESVFQVCNKELELRIRITKIGASYCQYISKENIEVEIMNEVNYENLSEYLNDIKFKIDAPLCKFVVAKYNCKILLGIQINHVICDGSGLIGLVNKIFKKYSDTENISSTKNLYYLDEYNKYYKSLRYKNDEAFWKEECERNSNCKSLKTNVSQHSSTRVSYSLSKELSNSFMDTCLSLGLSPASLLTAAMLLYTHKVTSEPLVTVATPCLLKNKANIDKLGIMINLVPITFDFSEILSFETYFNVLKKKWFSYLRHSKYPLNAINQEFRKKNNAVFPINTIVSYQNTSYSDEVIKNTIDSDWVPSGEIGFPLMIHFSQRRNNHSLIEIDYKHCIFIEEEIKGIYSFIVRFINKVCDNRETLSNILLSDLKISESNHEMVLAKNYNYREFSNIYDALSPIFKANRDRKALITSERAITYEQLEENAQATYAYLINAKISKGSVIGVYMSKSPNIISTALGILKAGCIYLPLDPMYPKKRNQYILSNAQPSLIFTDSDDYNLDNFININCIQFSKIPNRIERSRVETELEDIAYIIYTSGTTGKPKGVQISHANLLSLLIDSMKLFDFSHDDTWMFFHSHTFDFSIWEIFGSLITGASLYIPQKHDMLDMKAFADMIIKNNISVVNITPLAFYNLVADNIYLTDHNMKYVIFGGDTLSFIKLKDWYAKNSKTKLINMYGITETTIHVTYKEILERDLDKGISNIGNTIETLRMYVLDDSLEQVGIGNIGEVYVAGEGVSKGYLRNQDLTIEKFVKIPYEEKYVYKSGDLVRVLADSEYEYVGRVDKMVNVKGYRVELGEIETTLLKLSYIKSVVVIPFETNENTELFCFIVSAESELSTKILRNFISQHLPFYMIPNQFISIDEMPMTENGKIDHKVLTEHLQNMNRDRKELLNIGKNNEEIVQSAWNLILGLDQENTPHNEDNFYALGGDSIKAIQLISLLKENEIHVEMESFLQNPTKKYCLSGIDEKNDLIKIYKRKQGFCRFAPMHFYAFRNGLLNHYLQSLVIKSKVNVSKEKLIDILRVMSETHDVLRVVELNYAKRKFYYTDGDEVNIKVTESFVKDIDRDITKAFKNSCKTVNISKGVFGEAAILHSSDGIYILFSIHHSIIDGFSWRIFLEDFEALAINISTPLRRTMPFDSWTNMISSKVEEYRVTSEHYLERESAKNKDVIQVSLLKDTIYQEFEFDFTICTDFISHFKGNKQYSIENLFLTAFLSSLISFENSDIIVEKEVHGREQNVDRTLGWFTQIYESNLSKKNIEGNLYEALNYIYTAINESAKTAFENFLSSFVLSESYLNKDCIRVRYNYLGELSPFKTDKMVIHEVFIDKLISDDYEFSTDYEINILKQGDIVNIGLRCHKNKCNILPKLIDDFQRNMAQIADVNHFLNHSIDTSTLSIEREDLLHLLNDVSFVGN